MRYVFWGGRSPPIGQTSAFFGFPHNRSRGVDRVVFLIYMKFVGVILCAPLPIVHIHSPGTDSVDASRDIPVSTPSMSTRRIPLRFGEASSTSTLRGFRVSEGAPTSVVFRGLCHFCLNPEGRIW
jgi:hypothetical protein